MSKGQKDHVVVIVTEHSDNCRQLSLVNVDLSNSYEEIYFHPWPLPETTLVKKRLSKVNQTARNILRNLKTEKGLIEVTVKKSGFYFKEKHYLVHSIVVVRKETYKWKEVEKAVFEAIKKALGKDIKIER